MEDAKTRWVTQLNKLGREMDFRGAGLHPSARAEFLSDDLERYRELASTGKTRRRP